METSLKSSWVRKKETDENIEIIEVSPESAKDKTIEIIGVPSLPYATPYTHDVVNWK